ncbi:Hypothetical protein AKI40_0272 [Enterobacter sp. FY-07]|uniref:hypothetical protein n=1 Tax=Kosakonia oryzendophytica TaxID=1005665 RepID=UPI0007777F4E|nr:hypothetical protein [Kosakonia oryzendophytica]AMO46700.1 Hypothetical protein AKI40_0272 [Enterobacter sp. FY-07]WBT58473.1 hypothetical protein O9K67_01345 [Kosakonia oryzendophytica]
MIEVQSFIKSEQGFVDVFAFEGTITDPDYIDGALLLRINGVELINQAMWDYVDQLWAYFTSGLLALAEENAFETCFPDQPITVRFTPLRDQVLISVDCHGEVKAVVGKGEFIREMATQARRFFERIVTLKGIDRHAYDNEIHQLAALPASYFKATTHDG